MHLTPKQAAFVDKYIELRNATQAAIAAGYSPRCAREIASENLSKPAVRGAIEARQADARAQAGVDRQRVLDALLEAVEVARLQADPMAMIAGWREIAKICGFYAPTRAEVRLSAAGQAVRGRIEALSDEELLAMAESGAPVRNDV